MPKAVGFNHRTEVQQNLPPIPPSPAQQLPTPINIRCMLPFLSGYDHSIKQLLASGFTFGFSLHFDGPRCSQEAPNLLSALQNLAAVYAKLSKELDVHRLAGPFSSPLSQSFEYHPSV